jgi:acyl-CoA reductase-like NAD-dependent aldehyde dehydrogenase
VDLGLKADDAAARAFRLWQASTPATRRNIFLKASTVMDDRPAELKKYMLGETGCSEQWADFNIQRSKECLLDCAAKATNIEGRIPTLEKQSTGGLVLKEPYGVILAMAPWSVIVEPPALICN